MNSNQVVSLGTLEADLGLSRVDLLLVIREVGIEPIRKGMRTWIRQDQVSVLYKHLGKSNPQFQQSSLRCVGVLEQTLVQVPSCWGRP